MDFSLTDDHQALRDAVQRWCNGEFPAHELSQPETRAQAARRHAGMADLGLLGLLLPDPELGGTGMGAVESMLVAEQLGRVLANGNWMSNAVLAGPLLAEIGGPELCRRWLTALTSGDRQLALACHEPGARYDLSAVATRAVPVTHPQEGWCLNGTKHLVLGGDVAHGLLVLASTGDEGTSGSAHSLFLVDAATPGVTCQPVTLLDGRRAATLILHEVVVSADCLLGKPGTALPPVQAALDRAEAVLCAEAAGVLDALLAQTCEHLKTRRQFGVPLAKFQVLQHQVADMSIALEQVKSMACVAAMAQSSADPLERARLVSAAKVLTAQLGRRCGLAAIQMHGAMGMTEECRASHLAKRLITVGLLLGDASHHLNRFDRLHRPRHAGVH